MSIQAYVLGTAAVCVAVFLATLMGLSALDMAVLAFVVLASLVALCIHTDEGEDE